MNKAISAGGEKKKNPLSEERGLAAKASLEMVLESIGDGVIITDLSGSIVKMNAEGSRITGWSIKKACGRHLYDVFRIIGERTGKPDDPIQRALRSGKKVGLRNNTVLIPLDNTPKYVSASVSPIKDPEENFRGMVLVFRDITRIKEAEKELKKMYLREQEARDAAEEAKRTQGRFLENISHEMRTPLNGIIGMTDLIGITPLTPEQKGNLEIIKKSARSLLKSINNLIDISHIEAGKSKINMEKLSLETIIDETVNMHHLEGLERGITIKKIISPNIPQYLKGDEEKLRQVIGNMVSNAVKFTDTGEVIIRAERADESEDKMKIRVSVSDTGLGIAEKDLKRLFQPFCQADDSRTRKYGGTGVGLFICKRFVEMMLGEIEIQSEKGRGSTFSFTVELRKVFQSSLSTVTEMNREAVKTKKGAENQKTIEIKGESDIYYQKTEDNISSTENKDLRETLNLYLKRLKVSVNGLNLHDIEKQGFLIKETAYENDLPDIKRTALKITMSARSGKLEPVPEYMAKLEEYLRQL